MAYQALPEALASTFPGLILIMAWLITIWLAPYIPLELHIGGDESERLFSD
ncbi:MAG: hypothetical protein IPO25_10465 [Saprospiraceae bacterium]|nr:hypothetical protein [Saprospiraceae bacterium]